MAAAARTSAGPAQFDKPSQHRRSMLAKVQIGTKQLAIEEDDYRQAIFDISGQMSLAKCSDTQLVRMINWLKSKGFTPQPAGRKGAADHPMARKARALWISLHHLGAVHNPSDEALEAFARRQLKCERLIWARQSDAYKLIEALKDWAVREGWPQANPRTHKPVSPVTLQRTLCQAIITKLLATGIVSDEASAWSLGGIEAGETTSDYTAGDYDRLAKALGDQLRKHAAASKNNG